MKRKFWIGASFSALVIAAMAPWSASQASGVSIRVSTPEFGIRIGAPYFPPPVFYPVHQPRHYGYMPPVVYTAPRYVVPRAYGYPYHYAGGRGYGHQRHNWRNDRRHDNDDNRGRHRR